MSHDLKTPLRGISSLSQWLLEEYQDKLDSQANQYLNLIHKRTLQLHGLVDGILQYSKASSIKVSQSEPVDLTQVVEEVLDHCDLPSNFKVEYPANHPVVSTFKVGLYQILQNLITNAVKYNDKPSGEIIIEAVPEQDGGFQLTISDNGPGIPAPYREKVFQLFETLHQKADLPSGSVGVGLATVKSLTERMGGTIQICDRADKKAGACFILAFGKNQ